ncbi:MAG: M55 family metallopeptidase [Rickettsiales bacterium]|nr:M55 family metallopeptidase [Rickettsiales bacterium]
MLFFKKKKECSVWIYLDMEGVNNITSWDEVDPGCPNYHKGQALMMDEINSCVKGVLKSGVSNIFLNDLHWFSNNIISNKLNKKVSLVNGLNLMLPEFFSKSFDAIFIVGMHSKVNTIDGILSHSWYLPCYIKSIKYNDKPIGEVDIINLLAEEKGAPVIFISGDKAGCNEQKQHNNAITTVVKECTNGVISTISSKEANKLICKNSKQAIDLFKENTFEKKQNFYNHPLKVRFGNSQLCDTIKNRCDLKELKIERFDDETIVFYGNIFSEILNNFFSVLD